MSGWLLAVCMVGGIYLLGVLTMISAVMVCNKNKNTLGKAVIAIILGIIWPTVTFEAVRKWIADN